MELNRVKLEHLESLLKNLFSHRDKDIVLSELNLSPDKLTVLLMGVALGLEI